MDLGRDLGRDLLVHDEARRIHVRLMGLSGAEPTYGELTYGEMRVLLLDDAGDLIPWTVSEWQSRCASSNVHYCCSSQSRGHLWRRWRWRWVQPLHQRS